jgi:hypothetical protein
MGIPVVPGETLLFIDEIQSCQNAIRTLRYFREDYPELHVIAAGSLLEFALDDLPSFAVGRIRSFYLYPFSFDDFLSALGLDALKEFKTQAVREGTPLPDPMHNQLKDLLRTFYLVGGMPEAVSTWVSNRISWLAVECTMTFLMPTNRISPNTKNAYRPICCDRCCALWRFKLERNSFLLKPAVMLLLHLSRSVFAC